MDLAWKRRDATLRRLLEVAEERFRKAARHDPVAQIDIGVALENLRRHRAAPLPTIG